MMSTKSNTTKKRVSKNAKGIKTHFKVWFGVLVVLVVAVVGVVVVRLGEAYSQGQEVSVYCREGRCGRPGTLLGNRNRDNFNAQLTKVTVFPNAACASGYVYTFSGLSEQQRIQFAWKASPRNTTLLCLDSGSSPNR